MQVKDNWTVYMVRCSDNSLYTGITKDINKRLDEHNSGNKSGAKYTRSRGPVTLVYTEIAESHSQAAKREYEIKQMDKKSKEMMLLTPK
jgi:putative endonuclease